MNPLHTEVNLKDELGLWEGRKDVVFWPVHRNNFWEIGVAAQDILGYYPMNITIDYPNFKACKKFIEKLNMKYFNKDISQVDKEVTASMAEADWDF